MARDESEPAADRPEDRDDPTEECGDSPESGADPSMPDINKLAALRQARKDRLARIKSEIENGTYESDELLNTALERMVGRLPRDERPAEEEETS